VEEKLIDSEDARLGIPKAEFLAGADVVHELCNAGKYQILLTRNNFIRFVGEIDQFRVSLVQRLGGDAIEKKKAESILRELQRFLQVLLATGSSAEASGLLERQVYNEEFDAAKAKPDLVEKLRSVLREKVDAVYSKLSSEGLIGRGKRLATAAGAILEDLDIEIISSRKALTEGVDIESPFLRIRLRYSLGNL
jgi:hypothetical protein